MVAWFLDEGFLSCCGGVGFSARDSLRGCVGGGGRGSVWPQWWWMWVVVGMGLWVLVVVGC